MSNLVWRTETRLLKDLKPYERNPRRISKDAFEKLKRSLTEDGYHNRMAVDVDDVVIGGHQRMRAMQELGITEVEVLVPSRKLTDEEFDRINIRDNLPFGDFDMDILANNFTVDQLTDWGMPEEWLPVEEGVTNVPAADEENVPELPTVPKTVLGDVYDIGPHRLMCGDSTSLDAIDNLMNGKKADMVYTDPPYGMSYSGRGKKTSEGIMNDDSDPTHLYAVGIEVPERYIWGRVENYSHLPEAPRDVIIWRKNNFGMGRGYRGQYECCFYYGNFSGSDSDVWDVSKDRDYSHPTQKPVELCERAIRNSQPKRVIDYYGGSGATMVGCHKHNLPCHMMELDPKYCDVIVTRMHTLFPDLPIKLNGEVIQWS